MPTPPQSHQPLNPVRVALITIIVITLIMISWQSRHPPPLGPHRHRPCMPPSSSVHPENTICRSVFHPAVSSRRSITSSDEELVPTSRLGLGDHKVIGCARMTARSTLYSSRRPQKKKKKKGRSRGRMREHIHIHRYIFIPKGQPETMPAALPAITYAQPCFPRPRHPAEISCSFGLGGTRLATTLLAMFPFLFFFF